MHQLLLEIKAARNFPSPPAVAQKIIALANDPDVDMAKLAAVLSKDPALTAKVLRVANSPLYSQRRKSDNVRQSLVVLGLNGAITLALSFSLLSTYGNASRAAIDYAEFWRRTILGATASRLLARKVGCAEIDHVFLAAMLQDIAVLAIDRVRPDFYGELPGNASPAAFTSYECRRVGVDHAVVGAQLLQHWGLPEGICRIVEFSHRPEATERISASGVGARLVALGNFCAEHVLHPDPAGDPLHLFQLADQLLGLDSNALSDSLTELAAEMPELERLFERSLLPPHLITNLLDQAREELAIRTLQADQEIHALKATAESLQARTVALENQQRLDALTGLYNRAYLDEFLNREFESARAGGWSLSVIFADLDRFKLINDTYGHAAGDLVLAGTARLLQSVVRDTDCVARYGGEEFVVVLPGVAVGGAAALCERLLERLRDARYVLGSRSVSVTTSLGLATFPALGGLRRAADLLEAADRCVYLAKRSGRDRLVAHDSPHYGSLSASP